MRNFQFPEEIDFTRSKKNCRYTPGKRTLIQKLTVSLLVLMFLSILCALGIVIFW